MTKSTSTILWRCRPKFGGPPLELPEAEAFELDTRHYDLTELTQLIPLSPLNPQPLATILIKPRDWEGAPYLTQIHSLKDLVGLYLGGEVVPSGS